MKGFIQLIFLAVLLLGLEGVSQKKYNSLLWEISGNGLSKPSYLYGTMHVSRRVAFHLSDSFFIAINSANIVALESNPELWLESMNDPEQSSSLRKRGPSVSGPDGLYGNWFSVVTPKSNTFRGMLARDPNVIDGLLYRQSSGTKNFEEDTYLDLFIFQSGKKLGKKISSLEGLKESEELVDKAFLPDNEEDDEKELIKMKKMMKDMDGNIYEMMEDSYRRGDLDMLDSVSTMMNPGKNYRKYMLDERNIIMTHTMDSLMKKNVVFSAIGAAHLPGEMGVIELLRKKGYKVRSIIFSGERDSKMKEKIEKIMSPVSSKLFVNDDSAFQVMVPGKLTSLGGRWMKTYVYSDMANGSYYAVYRLNHMNAWTGLNESSLLAKIDSMLFENIPGKIQKKIQIKTPEGFGGYEIENKTKTGDVQRYKIIVTPLEAYVMKCSGPGEYVKKEKAVTQFFNTMQIVPQQTKMVTFHSASSGFSVEMPDHYFRVNKYDPLDTYSRIEEKLIGTSVATGETFMVMSTSCHDFKYLEEDSFELRIIADNFLEEQKFDRTSFSYVAGNNFSEFSGKKEGKYIFGRVYFSGTAYYMFAVHKSKDLAPATFFSSIKFFERSTIMKEKEVSDTSLYFKVKTSWERSGSAFDYSRYGYYKSKKKKKKDETHREEKKDITYVDRYTHEAAEVVLIKLHKYFSEDTLDQLWDNYEINPDKKTTEKKVGSKTWKVKNDQYHEYYLKDPASRVCIYRRFIQRNGLVWGLTTMADSSGRFTAGTQKFLDSFQPWDTLAGDPIDSDKSGMLLKDLLSADSLTRVQAEQSVYTVYSTFTDKHYSAMRAYFKTGNYYKLELQTRADLLSAMGKMGKSNVIPLLKDYFKAAGDTATLQLGALEALLRLGTKEGNLAFIEMMQIETPLISGNNTWLISGLFRQTYKKEDAAKYLFPALLEFTRYPEYESEIYSLLAELVEKKKIGPEIVLSRKAEILRNAKDELKRQLYKEEEKKDEYVEKYNRYSWMSDNSNYDLRSGFIQHGNKLIYDYSCLLVSHYSDPAVKNYFARIGRSKSAALKIAINALLVSNKVAVPDSIWKSLANTPGNRLVLIAWLNKIKRVDLLPKGIESDSLLMQAYAHYFQNVGKKDSLVQLDSKRMKNKLGEQTVYIYKHKDEEADKWSYFALMAGEKDTLGLPSVKFLSNNLYGLEYQDDDAEQKKELFLAALLYGRERAEKRYSGYNYGNNYDDFEDEY